MADSATSKKKCIKMGCALRGIEIKTDAKKCVSCDADLDGGLDGLLDAFLDGNPFG